MAYGEEFLCMFCDAVLGKVAQWVCLLAPRIGLPLNFESENEIRVTTTDWLLRDEVSLGNSFVMKEGQWVVVVRLFVFPALSRHGQGGRDCLLSVLC